MLFDQELREVAMREERFVASFTRERQHALEHRSNLVCRLATSDRGLSA
jgi:hypothetical protein